MELLKHEEDTWRQNCRATSIACGDWNTKFLTLMLISKDRSIPFGILERRMDL